VVLRYAHALRMLTVATVMVGLAAIGFATPAHAGAFEDTAGQTWDTAVQALVDEEVLYGCREGQFCPVRAVDRGQMASILVRALDLPEAADTDRFDDVEGSVHEDNINALAEAGITQGCSADEFCPNQAVSRAEMATLLTRAFEISETDQRYFDDTGGTHAGAIDDAAEAGIAAGCGDPLTAFCPRDDVQRWQAALFIARSMDLVERVEVTSLQERRERQDAIDAERREAERAAAQQEAASERAATAVSTARAQVGKPYQWGGNGPGSFDCSGLTSYAWRSAGVELPRTSSQQYGATTRISRGDLQPGDLIFYGRSGITHVAMYIGGGDIVEAPYSGQNVRISSTGLSRSDIVGYGRPA
jgi:cell wall-associated NlpC family hydrolase